MGPWHIPDGIRFRCIPMENRQKLQTAIFTLNLPLLCAIMTEKCFWERWGAKKNVSSQNLRLGKAF